jgi:hypothetical protein
MAGDGERSLSGDARSSCRSGSPVRLLLKRPADSGSVVTANAVRMAIERYAAPVTVDPGDREGAGHVRNTTVRTTSFTTIRTTDGVAAPS